MSPHMHLEPDVVHSSAAPLALDLEPPRFLSREKGSALVDQILGYTNGRGETHLTLKSFWRGDVRWARNRVAMASDWRDDVVIIDRRLLGQRYGQATTNQIDAASLRAAVDWAERLLQLFGKSSELQDHFHFIMPPGLPEATITYATPRIWSDSTYTQTADTRRAIADQLMDMAERAGMRSAGYLNVEAQGISYRLEDGRYLYAPQTLAQCSITVRDPEGTGSGWAGASSYDWERFNAQQLAEVALDKCLRSRNPVAIEPGRYTLIMEPQATFDLMALLLREDFTRRFAEDDRRHRFHKSFAPVTGHMGTGNPQEIGISRIGDRILDERISISYDPMDPDLGIIPFNSNGEAYVPVTWIDHGLLANLVYDTDYAQYYLKKPRALPRPTAFRMSGRGTPATMDEMITTTKRGLLVTRFWDIYGIDPDSLVSTGVTRDGLWLIENGKISKSVKNLRWTESPLFAFNNVEQIGAPVPVFNPDAPTIVPPIKVRDFSFTSLADAV